jgi:hypothetical protein
MQLRDCETFSLNEQGEKGDRENIMSGKRDQVVLTAVWRKLDNIQLCYNHS